MSRTFSVVKEVELIMRAQALYPHRPYLSRAAVRAARRSYVRAIQRQPSRAR